MNNLEVIRPNDLAKMLSVSLPTLWRMEKRGELPKKIQISERTVGWLKSDIQEWLESKKIEA